MRLFRLRFILLGLLLCIFHVWARTICGTEFTDPLSSAYRADVVLEGRVGKLGNRDTNGRYNATVSIKKIWKGTNALDKAIVKKSISIGLFGQVNDTAECVYSGLKRKKTYIFFLNAGSRYVTMSAYPLLNSKKLRKVKKDMKKLFCDHADKKCGKPARVKRLKKRKSLHVGDRYSLSCSYEGVPPAKIRWKLNGTEIEDTSLISYSIKRRSSKSKLKLQNVQYEDAGVYSCEAENIIISPKTSSKSVKIRVTDQPTSQFKRCKDQTLCLNGGTCMYLEERKQYCQCHEDYTGPRCQYVDIHKYVKEIEKKEKLKTDRTYVIVAVVIVVLIIIAIFIASYILAKRNKERFYRLRREKKLAEDRNGSEGYRLLDDTDGGRTKSEQTQTELTMQREGNGNVARDGRGSRDVETGFCRELGPNHVADPSERVNLYVNPLSQPNAQAERASYAKGLKRRRLQAVSADYESDESDLGDRDSPDCGGNRTVAEEPTLQASEAPTYSAAPPMVNGHTTPDEGMEPDMNIYPDMPRVEQPAEETPLFQIPDDDFGPCLADDPIPDHPRLSLSPNSSLTSDSESEGTSLDPLQPLYISEEDLIPTYGTNEDMLAPCVQPKTPRDQVADFVANNNLDTLNDAQEDGNYTPSDNSSTDSFSSNELKENSLQPISASWDENGAPNLIATGPYSFHDDIGIIGNPYSNIFDTTNVNNRNNSLDVLDDQDAVPL